MFKYALALLALDGVLWYIDPKFGGVFLIILFITNFIVALSKSS